MAVVRAKGKAPVWMRVRSHTSEQSRPLGASTAEARADILGPSTGETMHQAHAGDPMLDEAEGIERLLDRIHAAVPAGSWTLVEELVERLTRVYGAGLARLLDHARAAGAQEALLAERTSGDELLANLLLLHGLHPVPLAERIGAALERVRPQLGLGDGGVELVAVEDGVVRVRLAAARAAAKASIEGAIRAAVEAAAPEVVRIDVSDGARVALPVVP